MKGLLDSGEAMLFVGAGVEIGVHDSWTALVQKLLDETGIVLNEEQLALSHSEKAQLAKDKDEAVYKATILEEFGNWQPIVQKVMNGLAHMNVSGVITTNYDQSVDDTFRFKSFGSMGIQGLSAALLNGSQHWVFHIHGLITADTTPDDLDIILTSGEFSEYYGPDGIVREFLKTAFLQRSAVFIGVSFEDVDVVSVLRNVKNEERRLQAANQQFKPQQRFALTPLPFLMKGPRVLEWDTMEAIEVKLDSLGITPVWFEPDRAFQGLHDLLIEIAPHSGGIGDRTPPEAP